MGCATANAATPHMSVAIQAPIPHTAHTKSGASTLPRSGAVSSLPRYAIRRGTVAANHSTLPSATSAIAPRSVELLAKTAKTSSAPIASNVSTASAVYHHVAVIPQRSRRPPTAAIDMSSVLMAPSLEP